MRFLPKGATALLVVTSVLTSTQLAAAFVDKKKLTDYQLRPNQEAAVDNPDIELAERPCENWTWAAALNRVLKPLDASMGQEYQILRLYGGAVCSGVKDYAELAQKISHEYKLDDGRRFLLNARFVEGAPTALDAVILSLREQHPMIVVWKDHAYVLVGMVYDEYIARNGGRVFEVKEMKLGDPANGKVVSYQRDQDDPATLRGLMEISVKPLGLYQMR
jgi:hypothetical protein